MVTRYFKGYSTFPTPQNQKNRDWTLFDIELVKRDLLNVFYTVKGERPMMPTYGSIAWDLLFDPLTETNIDLIVEDSKRIIAMDSRIEMKSITVSEFEHGIIVGFSLLYKPIDVVDSFSIEFDRRAKEAD